MSSAARDGDVAFVELLAQLVEVNGFSGGVHVENALNEIHAVQVF